jgi:acyl-CoA thioesterase I
VIRAVAWGALVTALALVSPGPRAAATDLCAEPPGGVPITAPLERVAARIAKGGPLNIIAVGSSSTAGVGASSAEMNYPSRLEVELREIFPKLEIHVVNRGKSGEDAPEELARLKSDVVAAHPDLAIWQVGTNAVFRRDDLAADGELIREGVDLLKQNGIDAVLMDLQYAPRVLDRAGYPTMEGQIAEVAAHAHVGLFRRFALMRYWHENHAADDPAMIGADGLHMTDAGYHCLSKDLAAALAADLRSEAKLVRRARGAAGSVANLPPSSAGSATTPVNLRRNDAPPFN